ncbi:hypothetical protein AVEN_21615-1, partial [Araneus ventricosus]
MIPFPFFRYIFSNGRFYFSGLKKDLSPCVTRSMGRDMAHKIGAVSYVECSAKTKDGVKH